MEVTRKVFYILSLAVLVANVWLTQTVRAEDKVAKPEAQLFIGQDLYLAGEEAVVFQLGSTEHSLVFERGFSMSIGGNKYSSGRAAVWLNQAGTEVKATVYLCDEIKIEKSSMAKTAGIDETILEKDKRVIVELTTNGEIFITAQKQQTSDTRQAEIYKEGFAAAAALPKGPRFVVREESLVPQWREVGKEEERVTAKEPEEKAVAEALKPKEEAEVAVPAEKAEKVHYRYPVNLAPAGEASPKIEKFTLADGTEVATVIGRIYVWQKQDEAGRLLELQADNAVVFYTQGKTEQSGSEGVLAGGAVQTIYMCGDVLVTEGPRTIRADEIYYDFINKKALVTNSVLRTFDEQRGIPIYVRAAKLRQESANKFSAQDVVVTSSEFYKPQISLAVADAEITDTTVVDRTTGKVSDRSFDAQMRDVRMKVGDTTLLRWPKMRSNLARPDVPFKGIHVGNDSRWGTSLETRWYLSRLLGLREPKGTEGTLNLDYYSERGVGAGTEVEYERDEYFGRMIGYIINDHGEDRLGRMPARRDLEPPRELRGRFQVQHRQFLPFNWQATTEVGYLSDEHFLESFYRGEFDTGKKQETLVGLKRLEDNWAISILGKGRINNFADELEEMPSVEYHRMGESLFGDVFTLYSDTGISRLRQRIGGDHVFAINEDEFTFISHRTEIDMPLRFETAKVVPYVAGTFGYDDRSGFRRSLVDGSNAGDFGEKNIGIGEGGVRAETEFWKVYPSVQSRLWDVNGLRHIVRPEATAALFTESDSVVKQHDMLNLALSQRLQTKRGPLDKQRTVDWMRLDTEFTFVKDSEAAHDAGPDRFIWNQPMTPLRVLSAPQIFNDDIEPGRGLERVETFGPKRNYFGFDYIWRASDTFAVLSDGYYDMQSGVLQQYNIGIARLVWPNLSYYAGSRYLRRVEILDEKGSNAFIFAATYEIDPRYTVVFAQQYDFDFGTNMRSDITLIRRYHRLFYGLTFSADRSLDRQAIVFSIWPQGLPELALGPRRYTK